jgi:hypothetical protein
MRVDEIFGTMLGVGALLAVTAALLSPSKKNKALEKAKLDLAKARAHLADAKAQREANVRQIVSTLQIACDELGINASAKELTSGNAVEDDDLQDLVSELYGVVATAEAIAQRTKDVVRAIKTAERRGDDGDKKALEERFAEMKVEDKKDQRHKIALALEINDYLKDHPDILKAKPPEPDPEEAYRASRPLARLGHNIHKRVFSASS